MSAQGPSRIFRERALRQGDVLEALDERVAVAGAPRWIALALGVAIVLGFLAWAASDEVQQTVAGTGIVTSAPPPGSVEAPVAGTVTRPPPPVGTAITRDGEVARIDPGTGPDVPVRAYVAGQVKAVTAGAGAVVSAGDQLATIEPDDATPTAYLFVPLDDADQIDPGMEVLLSPEGPASQTSALLEATVRDVGVYPATQERLELVLGESLASTFADGPLVVEVGLELRRDASTPSGYAWTTGEGPDGPPALGTPLSGNVVVARQSPLQLMF